MAKGFDSAKLKQFLIERGEKIGLGAAVVLAGLLGRSLNEESMIANLLPGNRTAMLLTASAIRNPTPIVRSAPPCTHERRFGM